MNFDHPRNKQTMEVNGLQCTLNLPKVVRRIKNSDGSEGTAALPPHAPRSAFIVDEYPASPDSWMHGSPDVSSFFVPIKAEHGMWLDFTDNMHHTHHVAARVTIQGIDPITGLKTDPLRLEQYKNKCPRHDIEFGQDRFCSECKYKWPAQNYLCSNSGQAFWIDGFRTEDGTVRQYYFTEEEAKGVAAQIIGKDRVFAIGVAFYLSKEPKPAPKHVFRSYGSPAFLGGGAVMDCFTNYCDASPGLESLGATAANVSWDTKSSKKTISTRRTRGMKARSSTRSVEEVKSDVETNQKMLEIGAGAKINQTIGADPENLDFWEEKPAGVIYINYCDEETAAKIIEAGKRDEAEGGFLAGLDLREDNFVEEGPHPLPDVSYPADKNCWMPPVITTPGQDCIPESGVE